MSGAIGSKGLCRECRGVFRLTGSGLLYRHGGKARGGECAGSAQTPVTTGSGSAAPAEIAKSADVTTAVPLAGVPASGCADFSFLLSSERPRLVDHIPKGARASCRELLSRILADISRAPFDALKWRALLLFGREVLVKPARGGRRHNVTGHIRRQADSFCGTAEASQISHPGCVRRCPDKILAAAVSAKIEQGDLRGAVRLMCSDERPAEASAEVLQKLVDKHPRAPADRAAPPSAYDDCLIVSAAEVLAAVRSFPQGSAGGLDCVRPQHLRDLMDPGATDFIDVVTSFVNLLLRGSCPVDVRPYLFGGNLIALSKKDGGLRPIAIGSVWRRLAAKCASSFAGAKLQDYLKPRQVGVGVKGGAEAAIHATRLFLRHAGDGRYIMKLDFSNAFNSVHRDAVLAAVRSLAPEILNFCLLAYEAPSILSFKGRCVSSEEGVQQGDPLGPLLFSLVLQPILAKLCSEFVVGYLDDVTAGGDVSSLAHDFDMLRSAAEGVGLSLNIRKCELVGESLCDQLPGCFLHFRHISSAQAELLGAPLFEGAGLDSVLESKCLDLARASERLRLLNSHDALTILRHSISAPKLSYLLRCSPCSDHPSLVIFDGFLRTALASVTNVAFDDLAWVQASLPIADGGLGVRSVALLAPSAFLASAASTHALQTDLLARSGLALPPQGAEAEKALSVWKSRHVGVEAPEAERRAKQRHWDAASIALGRAILERHCVGDLDRARLLAVQAPHSGDWLSALPITSIGLRLDDDAIRFAVGLRIGAPVCTPGKCNCGAMVDARGTHVLACKRGRGRQLRHAQLNDCIYRALVRADVPSMKEPGGLLRGDGKRPDGCTSLAWKEGKCLAWDVTVPDTLANSYVGICSAEAGAAAERASLLKIKKYENITRTHLFCPIAVETLGPINLQGQEFLDSLGHLTSRVSGDQREAAFLFQRISIVIQRCNAVCLHDCLMPPDEV